MICGFAKIWKYTVLIAAVLMTVFVMFGCSAVESIFGGSENDDSSQLPSFKQVSDGTEEAAEQEAAVLTTAKATDGAAWKALSAEEQIQLVLSLISETDPSVSQEGAECMAPVICEEITQTFDSGGAVNVYTAFMAVFQA